MIIKTCITCKKDFSFRNAPSDIEHGGGKYCSKLCQSENMSSVLKGKGIKPKQRFVAYNENHPLWKGDSVSYSGLHYWVKRKLGKPEVCSNDIKHESKRFVWANISGRYTRNLSDWHSLCTSCNLGDGVRIAQRFII